jgi:hypothetical protein
MIIHTNENTETVNITYADRDRTEKTTLKKFT